MTTTTATNKSYKSTVTYLTNQEVYRVKVTYNNGDNVAFLGSFDTEKAAIKAAKRELKKISK